MKSVIIGHKELENLLQSQNEADYRFAVRGEIYPLEYSKTCQPKNWQIFETAEFLSPKGGWKSLFDLVHKYKLSIN